VDGVTDFYAASLADLPGLIAAHKSGARLTGELRSLFRARHLTQTYRFASLWSLAVGLLNVLAGAFDALILPAPVRAPVLALRVMLALAFLAAAYRLGRPRGQAFSPLTIIVLSLLMLTAGGVMGQKTGTAQLYITYQGMGLAIVCTAIVFGQMERAAVIAMIGLACALLAVSVALSPLPDLAEKAQFVVYYSLFMAGLGFARLLQDRTAERLFLLQLRDELAADEIALRNDQLASMACTDQLTGIANRRAFDEIMDSLRHNAAWALPVALCMLDIDHFKLYNDRFGHVAGDECLREAAAQMRAQLRRHTDILARYGGEEFVLILPNTSRTEALEIITRVQGAVFAMNRPHPASPFGRVTVSAGLAMVMRGAELNGLVARADDALYLAKQAGRNQVAG